MIDFSVVAKCLQMAERAIHGFLRVVVQRRCLQYLAAKDCQRQQADEPEVATMLEEGGKHPGYLGVDVVYLSARPCKV